MTEPRVRLLDDEETTAALARASAPDALADLAVFRALLHSPNTARAVNGMLTGLAFKGRLDPRLRELIIMRVAWCTASGYEWAHHWPIAGQVGITDADLLAVRDWRSAEGFDDRDRAVLRATDELLDHRDLTDEAWQECRAQLRDTDLLVELVAVIENWSMIATLVRVLQVPLENGRAPWPPDGVQPV